MLHHVQVLGLRQEWKGLVTKVILLRTALEQWKDQNNTVIMFVDR